MTLAKSIKIVLYFMKSNLLLNSSFFHYINKYIKYLK